MVVTVHKKTLVRVNIVEEHVHKSMDLAVEASNTENVPPRSYDLTPTELKRIVYKNHQVSIKQIEININCVFY